MIIKKLLKKHYQQICTTVTTITIPMHSDNIIKVKKIKSPTRQSAIGSLKWPVRKTCFRSGTVQLY